MDVKSISFGQGIQRSPSLSMQSGELSECVNLVPRGGELVNVHPPREVTFGSYHLSSQGTLVYLHESATYKHFIFEKTTENGYAYYWLPGTENDNIITTSTSRLTSWNAVGKFLTALSPNGLITLQWDPNNSKYKVVGDIPEIDLAFSLSGQMKRRTYTSGVKCAGRSTSGAGEEYSDQIYTAEISIPSTGTKSVTWQKDEIISKGVAANENYVLYNLTPYTMRITAVNGQARSEEIQSGKKSSPQVLRGNITFSIVANSVGTVSVGLCTNPNGDNTDTDYCVRNTEENFQAIYGDIYEFLDYHEKNQKKFVRPFFVRFALRLYDGTLTNHSAPMLMLPNFGITPLVFMTSLMASETEGNPIHVAGYATELNIKPKFPEGFSCNDWKDIVSGVAIAVSKPLDIYDFDHTRNESINEIGLWNFAESKLFDAYGIIANQKKWLYDDVVGLNPKYIIQPPHLSETKFSEDLAMTSEFYIVKEYTLDEISGLSTTEFTTIDPETLKASGSDVATLTVMSDDFGSHNRIYPNRSFSYNGRLHAANLKYEINAPCGCTSVDSRDNSRTEKTRLITYIEVDGKEVVADTGWKDGIPSEHWIYFPHDNAIRYKLFRQIGNGYSKAEGILLRHRLLFGSYKFSYRASEMWTSCTETEAKASYAKVDNFVYVSNAIYTSKLYNPFFFPSANTSTVGSGKIHAISTSAKALSSGTQFGAFPLYCFCSDGIWPLTPAADGTFDAPNPLSRDVLPEGCDICQIDAAIIFPTNAGLKFVEGQNSTGISQVMNGYNISEGEFFNNMPSSQAFNFANLVVEETDDFATIIKSSRMLYDYANGLLHIYPKTPVGNTDGYYKHYAFSLAEKAWTTIVSQDSNVKAVVPGYPYSYIQTASGDVMQFTDEADLDVARYGTLLTREIPFGDPFALKVLADLRHLKSGKNSEVSVKVFVSNDRTNWYSLPSLRSRAFKWFRFRVCTKLKDLDTLTALQCLVETRRSSKLR